MGKDFGIGLKGDDGSAEVCSAHLLNVALGYTPAKGHAVGFTVAAHFGQQAYRQGVDARNANPVQPAGNLIVALVEFAAGVQHREHHLERRFAFLRHEADGDAPPVVGYSNGAVAVDANVYVFTISPKRLVYGVVYHFVNEVVQAS